MTNKEKSAVVELLSIIDYLAAPSPTKTEPHKRARIGVECGTGARWDGGKLWRKTDARIERAVKRVRASLA